MTAFFTRHPGAVLTAIGMMLAAASGFVAWKTAAAVVPAESRVTTLEAQYQEIQRALSRIEAEQREQRSDIKELLRGEGK
jgi:hypothetical protein